MRVALLAGTQLASIPIPSSMTGSSVKLSRLVASTHSIYWRSLVAYHAPTRPIATPAPTGRAPSRRIMLVISPPSEPKATRTPGHCQEPVSALTMS